MVRLTDRPHMTLDVYRGRKTTMQQQQIEWGFEDYFEKILISPPHTPKRCDPHRKYLVEIFLIKGNKCFMEKYEKLSLNYTCYPFLSGAMVCCYPSYEAVLRRNGVKCLFLLHTKL